MSAKKNTRKREEQIALKVFNEYFETDQVSDERKIKFIFDILDEESVFESVQLYYDNAYDDIYLDHLSLSYANDDDVFYAFKKLREDISRQLDSVIEDGFKINCPCKGCDLQKIFDSFDDNVTQLFDDFNDDILELTSALQNNLHNVIQQSYEDLENSYS